MRMWSWLILSGVGSVSVVGCASHKVDPYTAAGVSRPTDEEVAANAGNEVWKVSDLTFHDSVTGGYWSFIFSPQSPNNPDYTSSPGRVENSDLVVQTAVAAPRSPVTRDISIIIVRHGSISEETASVTFPAPTPREARPNGPDTQQGGPQSPALETHKTPATPI